ncbi:MAG: ADP-ribosylglycohydrolase family protein [Deltaproteobacteria bacterium]|nr:ADP-ribosylglycohydrolase family protein [Deltaproteobacteria bacterium]
MKDRLNAMVLSSLVADALSLGAHWVYNTNVIDRKFGRVDGYHDPLTSFHKGKKAGEQTHYGDQVLVLMEHLSDGKDIHTCGSESDDLAGASRIAPLCHVYAGDVEKLVAAVRQQTAFTHDNATVIETADFFSRAAVKVLDGAAPLQAVDAVVGDHFKGSTVASLVKDGLDSAERETRQVIADFGQECSIEAALPGAIHLIARYENDFEAALVENVMAGGDSSARGMPAAMILGAHHGMEAIPGQWLDGLASRARVEEFFSSI